MNRTEIATHLLGDIIKGDPLPIDITATSCDFHCDKQVAMALKLADKLRQALKDNEDPLLPEVEE